ncbi:hypothetical protein Q0590_36105 [Rhodocytophaga aerolata]|uniref:Lipoprotein n=1 Tax=Rhodocytophaga aerolata TaxID=455078 RepID=A0ABT8RI33_9BACT|nr:hypothetical protein [Rhodocytophaga aerolata]MDO1451754.1 hypothetical protein [Rhodocytophaga aerolata]
MNRLIHKTLIVIIVFFFSGCKEQMKEEKCEFRTMKRMKTFSKGLDDTRQYQHMLLIKDFSKSCFDSLTCMKLLRKYIDTASVDIPIESVSFHNSGEWYYNPNPWVKDATEDPDQINDQMVTAIINDDGSYEFVFYDDNGGVSYRGTNWQQSN